MGELPREFTVTETGESFLLYDNRESMGQEGRILIFATKENLRILSKSRIWFVDGTFKTSPKIFLPIFTIHGLVHEHAFPMVYSFLENKQEIYYVAIFQAVKAMASAMRVNIAGRETVISDFELSIVNAVRLVFPRSQSRLCFFHLGQSTWRNVQEHGLQAAYINTDTPRNLNCHTPTFEFGIRSSWWHRWMFRRTDGYYSGRRLRNSRAVWKNLHSWRVRTGAPGR